MVWTWAIGLSVVPFFVSRKTPAGRRGGTPSAGRAHDATTSCRGIVALGLRILTGRAGQALECPAVRDLGWRWMTGLDGAGRNGFIPAAGL